MVENENKEFGVFTFDFNQKITINKNGDNYLISDKDGNKSIGTYEKGMISLNKNCNILIDLTEDVLVETCQSGSNLNSVDYWPKEKASEYVKSINGVNYKEYIDELLSSSYRGYNYIPSFDELPDSEKSFIDDAKLKNNPFYPFMCFGDFNGDNKLPDIAAIIGNAQAGFDIDYFEVVILHAGSSRIKKINYSDEFCPWIEKDNQYKHWNRSSTEGEMGDVIRTNCNEKRRASYYYWRNDKYNIGGINLH